MSPFVARLGHGRLKATAPTMPGLRENASAFIMAAFGLKHSTASPAATPSSEGMNGRERSNLGYPEYRVES